MSSGQEDIARKRKRDEEQNNQSTPGKTGRTRRKKPRVQGREETEDISTPLNHTSATPRANDIPNDEGSWELKSEDMATLSTSNETAKKRRRQKTSQSVPELEIPSQNIPSSIQHNPKDEVLPNGSVTSHTNGSGKKRKATVETMKKPSKPVLLEVDQTHLSNAMVTVKHKKTEGHRGGGTEKHQWTLSDPFGGVLLRVDPLYSVDEKHVILATEHGVQVYSTSTSLLVASLFVDTVTAYTLSAGNPELLYVANRKGQISIWNWLEGKRVNRWTIDSQISSLTSVVTNGTNQDTIFTLDKGKQWMITVHKFGNQDDPKKTDLMTLLKHDTPLRDFKVLEKGSIVCVTTMDGFIVGKRSSSNTNATSIKDYSYTWRAVKTSEPPTCIAMRSGAALANGKQAKRKGHAFSPAISVDIAVGGLTGCVYVYHDVLNKLDMNGPPGKAVHSSSALTAREMHWHREPVGALAWSLDGNYVISGGRETVLVLWQLDTGKRQYLPNLESPIQALTVSPSGTSYAIRLGDNSVMILSTSELKPISNIAGIQALSTTAQTSLQHQVRTVESTSKERKQSQPSRVNAVINPRNLQQLLLVVPAYQGSASTTDRQISSPYLQTFDIATSRHISRQAMTRTNATNTTLGPDGNRIREPDVKHLQISSNGQWLATVDEWSPPQRDVADLSVNNEDAMENVQVHRDSQLRFWSWNSREKQWNLNSRITTPHTGNDPLTKGNVLDLATNPSDASFATVGEDSVVRIWMSAAKLSDGRVVRGDVTDESTDDVWWKKRLDIPLRKDVRPASSAKVAYTVDGTCLAVYQSFSCLNSTSSHRGQVHFIDTDKGVLQSSRDNLLWSNDEICDMGFLEQYLIVVGRQAAQVWDVTTWEVHAHIPITSRSSTPNDQTPPPRLAINSASRTFALVVSDVINEPTERTKAVNYNNLRTRLRIYSPFGSELDAPSVALFETTLPRPALAVLSAEGTAAEASNAEEDLIGQRRGYVVLDSDAVLRTVRPRIGRRRTAFAPTSFDDSATQAEETTLPTPPASDTDGEHEDEEEEGEQNEMPPMSAAQPQDRNVVRPEQLADLFDYPTHAPPSMRELCRGVTRLFAGPGRPVEDDAVMTEA